MPISERSDVAKSRVSLLIRRITRILLVATAIGLLAFACGGGDSDTSEALTKDEYIAQANSACNSYHVQNSALGNEFVSTIEAEFPDGVNTTEEYQEFLVLYGTYWEAEASLYQGMIEDLRALSPPESDADLLADLYDDMHAVSEEFDALVNDAVDGDESANEAVFGSNGELGSAAALYDDVDQRNMAYGLSACVTLPEG